MAKWKVWLQLTRGFHTSILRLRLLLSQKEARGEVVPRLTTTY